MRLECGAGARACNESKALRPRQIACATPVSNRPGANGVIGIDLVAKAAPEGYTMLLTTGSFTGNIVLYRKLPCDGVRDFAPITQVARSYGMVLVVNPGVPAQSTKELIAVSTVFVQPFIKDGRLDAGGVGEVSAGRHRASARHRQAGGDTSAVD